MSQEKAQGRADKIRERFRSLSENFECIPVDIEEAYQCGDWDLLGYETWEAYIEGEYQASWLKLEASMRKRWVQRLNVAGMSAREIAPVVNVSHKTVLNDLPGKNDPGRSSPKKGKKPPAYPTPTPEPDPPADPAPAPGPEPTPPVTPPQDGAPPDPEDPDRGTQSSMPKNKTEPSPLLVAKPGSCAKDPYFYIISMFGDAQKYGFMPSKDQLMQLEAHIVRLRREVVTNG